MTETQHLDDNISGGYIDDDNIDEEILQSGTVDPKSFETYYTDDSKV